MTTHDDTARAPGEPPAAHLDGDASFDAMRVDHLTEPLLGSADEVRARFGDPVRAAYLEARAEVERVASDLAASRRRSGS